MRSRRLCTGTVALLLIAGCAHPAPTGTPAASPSAARPTVTTTRATPVPVAPQGDFRAVARLVDDAIAAGRMPGAVVQVGHGGAVVFRQAFGSRKLPGEPDLEGIPSPAEPMTEDTVFDLASVSKILSTTTSLLQLYEHGRVDVEDPVQKYLPEFNPGGDPRRAQVTLRMLLTHSSGIAGDLSRQGPWGLVAADKEEGIRRALAAPVEFPPGEVFHYSDIGFILLGTIVERITGRPLEDYARDNVFGPLRMADTRYLPAVRACGPHRIFGNAVAFDPSAPDGDCAEGGWPIGLLTRVAPTARDEDTPGINPDFGRLLRGTVHDPTARRMGGVAGSAGVFATADDVGRYAQGLLDRLAGRPSAFPLSRATVEMMTTPQQPAGVAGAQRGFGWDIDTYQSTPRGTVFPVGSFGHTGFTGVTIWIDPGSDSYVVVLGNVIHTRGGPPISELSGAVATAAARALHLYGT